MKLKMQDLQSLEQAKLFFLSGLEKLNGNDFAGAEIDFQSSLKFGKESPVETNRFLAQINLAKVYAEQGKISEAKLNISLYSKSTSCAN